MDGLREAPRPEHGQRGAERTAASPSAASSPAASSPAAEAPSGPDGAAGAKPSQACLSPMDTIHNSIDLQEPETTDAVCAAPPAGALVRHLLIVNKRGLHARASAKFVQTVERFDADVKVCRNGEEVHGCSIMGLMMLAAATGTTVRVSATGPQAEAVLDALAALVADRFGEEE